ncbi:hypothetical protein LXA28_18330, partial [Erwinia amylovora]|uniref:hypothetical protein n=1 Tax=Erwinia amylovora TaxID=552 RepID=UPI0020C138DC
IAIRIGQQRRGLLDAVRDEVQPPADPFGMIEKRKTEKGQREPCSSDSISVRLDPALEFGRPRFGRGGHRASNRVLVFRPCAERS